MIVTGGAGFVGSALSRRLRDEGHQVLCLDTARTGLRQLTEAGVCAQLADVTDPAAMNLVFERFQPTTVYHLAAIHFIPACTSRPDLVHRVNVEGTLHVARAARRVGARRLVLASSGSVYGSGTARGEEMKGRPIEAYGRSKYLAELAAISLLRPPRVRIARIFNIYGPGERTPHVIPTLVRQALRRDFILVGDLRTQRDYVHLDDVVEALILLGFANARSWTFNIGTGIPTSGELVLASTLRTLRRRGVEVRKDLALMRDGGRYPINWNKGRNQFMLGSYEKTLSHRSRRPGANCETH